MRTIAFYNVENLFDINNDSLIYDDERSPTGAFHWTAERYDRKVRNIAKVLAEIGYEVTQTSPDIIGLCEIENRKVLEDIIRQPELRDKGYGILHMDSPDERGIDVALLYKKATFLPVAFQSRRLLLFDPAGHRDYTRDQLVVGGFLDGELWHFIVNHWPSRSGGELRSRPNRIAAAQLNKRIIDSIFKLYPFAKTISMGDFNDDPINSSIKKVLNTIGDRELMDSAKMFNPMERFYKKGFGTLAYRDNWNLFDQFITSPFLLTADSTGYFFWKAGIYSPVYLKTPTGRFKGYPLRTYSGTTYLGGYADHFPVYLYLLKQTKRPSPK